MKRRQPHSRGIVSDTTKTAIATVVACITTVLQCVVGYTNLGARIGIERIVGISSSGVIVLLVVTLWVASVDLPRRLRRTLGITATFIATGVTVGLLCLTYDLHSILVTQTRERNTTTTSLRGAPTKAEATIYFYTKPSVPIVLAGINTHDTVTINAVRVEHTSDTDFTLHAFQYPQRVTITSISVRLPQLLLDTDGSVTFTTRAAVMRQGRVAILGGGIAWITASLLIWWLSRSHQPSDKPKSPAGFRITAPRPTQQPASACPTSPLPPTAPTTERTTTCVRSTKT
jgi:hypothetical protein